MVVDRHLEPKSLEPALGKLFDLSAKKILALEKSWDHSSGAPVFTKDGMYQTRGWTEWTQGFQFGSELLQFEATGDRLFLDLGLRRIREFMTRAVTHTGVHDHGFTVVSTFGNWRRLINQGLVDENPAEREYVELALKCSGAVQACRWTPLADGKGFIHSFNGPHSLFADTIRTLRSLALSHSLGHVLAGEGDRTIDLLSRLIDHAKTTAEHSVYYGEGRDIYDVRGRVAHESIFNAKDGVYCCPSTQQGYSPFSTWTRALAWIMCGFAEELEFCEILEDRALEPFGGRPAVESFMERAAAAVCDYYLDITAVDGIPFWDTGAPGLARLGDWQKRPADPFNEWEPVDSSAAAIAVQGLVRFGLFLERHGRASKGRRYRQAGLTLLRTLLEPPYISDSEKHQGLLLHSVYHRPRGWDHVPRGRKVPCNESSMWGDYHIREAALIALRMIRNKPIPVFFE